MRSSTLKIVLISIISVIFVICISVIANKQGTIQKDSAISNVDISSNINKYFTNKFSSYSTHEDGDMLYIGSNTKEIENGYFDIKINKSNYTIANEVLIYINRLNNTKTINTMGDNIDNYEFVNETFINSLIDSINNIFEYGLTIEQKVKLKEYIEKRYKRLRKINIDELDKLSQEMQDKLIETLGNVKISFKVQDNMLVLKIVKD